MFLCAKAGSTGLNLIGAQRMIMMEPDWNPKKYFDDPYALDFTDSDETLVIFIQNSTDIHSIFHSDKQSKQTTETAF